VFEYTEDRREASRVAWFGYRRGRQEVFGVDLLWRRPGRSWTDPRQAELEELRVYFRLPKPPADLKEARWEKRANNEWYSPPITERGNRLRALLRRWLKGGLFDIAYQQAGTTPRGLG
jgi:hypothetical protein